MPQPSLHLLAGMLKAYHPHLSSSLLRVVATTGRMLDSIFAKPETNLENLAVEYLRQHFILQEEHLAALRLVVDSGSALVADIDGLTLQLQDAGLLETSPLDSSRLFLADPKLITIHALQKALNRASPDPTILNRRLNEAERKVLELLVRQDLVVTIIHHLGLSGWWQLLGLEEILQFVVLTQ